MNTITCPSCGKQFDESAKFCDACGTSLAQAARGTHTAPGSETTQIACPNCGRIAEYPTEKFCADCGQPISLEAVAAPAPATASAPAPAAADAAGAAVGTVASAPAYTVPTDASASTSAPAASAPFVQPLQDISASAQGKLSSATSSAGEFFSGAASAVSSFNMGDMVSKFNDKMGTSLDLDAVGSDFTASSVSFENATEEALSSAFRTFGVALPPKTQTASVDALVSEIQSRRVAGVDGSLDTGVKTMADLDTSSREQGSERFVSYGMFATGLSEQFVPRAEMVLDGATMAAAEDRKRKDRLKTQVEMGEISLNEAVDRSQK